MALPSTSFKGVKWIAGGWAAFAAENVILSENRDEIISRVGVNNYHLLYSTISSAACLSIAFGYYSYVRKQGPTLVTRSYASQATGFVSQALGFVGLSQMLPEIQIPFAFTRQPTNQPLILRPGVAQSSPSTIPPNSEFEFRFKCPMDFKAYMSSQGDIFGVERVSRHPVFWSLGLSCAGIAFRTKYISELVMFSSPLVMAVIGTEHMDSRYRRGKGGLLTAEKEAKTSNIPFAALVTGRQAWSDLIHEMRWNNAVVAMLLAVRLALVKR